MDPQAYVGEYSEEEDDNNYNIYDPLCAEDNEEPEPFSGCCATFYAKRTKFPPHRQIGHTRSLRYGDDPSLRYRHDPSLPAIASNLEKQLENAQPSSKLAAIKATKKWAPKTPKGAYIVNHWAEWEKTARPPAMYNPPQLLPSYSLYKNPLGCLPWFTHRSIFCSAPSFPCCMRDCVLGNMPGGYSRFDATDADETLYSMLHDTGYPLCKDELKGMFWMHQNDVAAEVMASFQDMQWLTPNLGIKDLRRNWSRDHTAYGADLMFANAALKNKLRIEMSPNGKWMVLDSFPSPIFMYRIQEGDKFKLPEGNPNNLPTEDGKFLKHFPGDWMRLNYKFEDTGNPEDDFSKVDWDKPGYQYLAQKIAYLDPKTNQVVKTAAFDDLTTAMKMSETVHPNCVGYSFCCTSKEDRAKSVRVMNQHQVYLNAPPVPQDMNRLIREPAD